jgi:hypothetical protein
MQKYNDNNEERMVMSIVWTREKSQIMKRKKKKEEATKTPWETES